VATLGADRLREHPIDRAEKSRQSQVDEIDASDAQHDVAADHDAFIQEPIEHVEKRRVFGSVEDEIDLGGCFCRPFARRH
jgi:hypothetical protein